MQVCESHDIRTDVAFINDEHQDLCERWNALSITAEYLLKESVKQQESMTKHEIAPVEEAILEMRCAVQEEEPISWDVFGMESYVASLDVSISVLCHMVYPSFLPDC